MNHTALAFGFLIAFCCTADAEGTKSRAASDRATITSAQNREHEWRVEFAANLDIPASESDSFLPSGSPLSAEAELLCPMYYEIVDYSEVKIEKDPDSGALFARLSATVICKSEPPPCGSKSSD
jgi:uncharacterized protein YceK